MKKEEFLRTIDECQFPIKRYYPNVIAFIENKCKTPIYEHKKAINSGKIQPGIGFSIKNPVKSPYAGFGKIIFTEAYFGILWTTIYYLYLTFQKGYMAIINNKMLKVEFSISANLNQQMDVAYSLFKWGISLKEQYSEWPVKLVNFNTPDSFREGVTKIWEAAVAFVFYHEYAHALGIQVEEEADEFAIKEVMESGDQLDKDARFQKVVGCISAFTANFFMIKNAHYLKQNDGHPDVDDRIYHLVNRAQNLIGQDRMRSVKLFVAYSIAIFFRENSSFQEIKLEGKDEDEMLAYALLMCKILKERG